MTEGRIVMPFKIWVGKRESDILTYSYFDESITFWGNNTNGNHSFCTNRRIKDNYGDEFTNFVIKHLLRYISKYQDIEIHFYNNSFAYKLLSINSTLKPYIININSRCSFDVARHKTLSRVWLQNSVDVPQFTYLSKNEFTYDKLINKFDGYNKFVIQKSISGGGNGTYLMDSYNYHEIVSQLDSNDVFLVSPYYEKSESISCHLMIYDDGVMIFPVSHQLLNHEANKIAYCGNKYLDNNCDLSINIKKNALMIGNRLKDIEYRGICGLDFIYSNNKILLIEINPRYQGSSYLINAELNSIGLPSLFELNKMAFCGNMDSSISSQIDKMVISYESHTCFYKKNLSSNIINHPQNASVFFDGLQNVSSYEDGVYLYRYLKLNNE